MKLPGTPASLHHADQTVNAVRLINKLSVHAYRIISVVPLAVDPSALSVLSVPKIKHVSIRNALIHAQALVD